MRPTGVAVLALLLAPALLTGAPTAADAASDADAQAIARGVAYLRAHVADADLYVPWVAMGVAAVHDDLATFRATDNGPSLLIRLRDAVEAAAESTVATDVQRDVLAVTAALADPARFAATDLPARLHATRVGGQIGEVTLVNDDIYGVFAFHALGVPLDDAAIQEAAAHVERAQQLDGSWSYVAQPVSAPVEKSVDLTADAICALRLAGRAPDAAAITRALDWLESRQNADGGFPRDGRANAASTVQATAHVLHGLRCAGEDPDAARWSASAARGPRAWLLAAQTTDGSWWNGGAADTWATAEAVQALARRDQPLVSFVPAAFSFTPSRPTRVDDVTLRDVTDAAEARRVAWRIAADGAAVTLEGAVATHRFAALGEHRVTMDHWGDGRQRGRAAAVITVVNTVPVAAVASAPVATHRATPVTVDASASTDADGQIAAWRFAFGDGAVTPWVATPLVTHTYTTVGTFNVQAWVRDDDGAERGPATATVVITNRPPTLAVAPAVTVARGAAVPFGLTVADADGDVVNVTWRTGLAASWAAAPPRFAEPGVFKVTVQATDALGATATAATRVTVANAAPTFVQINATAAGRNVTLAATVTDADDAAVTVTWHHDGAIVAAGTRAAWLAPAAGTFTLRAVAADPWGAAVAQNVSVHVASPPRESHVSAPAESQSADTPEDAAAAEPEATTAPRPAAVPRSEAAAGPTEPSPAPTPPTAATPATTPPRVAAPRAAVAEDAPEPWEAAAPAGGVEEAQGVSPGPPPRALPFPSAAAVLCVTLAMASALVRRGRS